MAKAKKRKQIRVGVIGQGRSGYDIHVGHLRTDRRFKVVAVADPLERQRADAVNELGADGYADHADLLARDDLDLVVNASPSHLRVPIALEAFKAGHNVLCEKPLARTVRDVDRMIRAAKGAGKLLAVYQQSRFAPYFEQVKKVIDSGVLGRIVMIKCAFNGFARRWDWQTLQENHGGNLLNTGPHPMDQVLQLFGDGKPEVKCIMDRANTWGNAEDHVKVLLTGKNRPTIDLEISSCAAYSPYTYMVYGTKGGLTATTTEAKWKYFRPVRAPKQTLIRTPLEGRQYCREKLPWVEKTWTVPKGRAHLFPTMAKAFYTQLYNALTEGTPLIVTLEQVRRQIAVMEECHRQNPLSKRRGWGV
ncbi:MAG: Gfo/Idh/MocA family oxidoreductase [Candidatus Brocadiaceae bacterium]|nr:Gfo/Idh/MocA family oxidoreductase [Candidatus Brocadiaceae bacterium]